VNTIPVGARCYTTVLWEGEAIQWTEKKMESIWNEVDRGNNGGGT